MPIDLRAAVRAKSRATGVSLSAVVRSALAAWVADERPIVEPADLDAQLDAAEAELCQVIASFEADDDEAAS